MPKQQRPKQKRGTRTTKARKPTPTAPKAPPPPEAYIPPAPPPPPADGSPPKRKRGRQEQYDWQAVNWRERDVDIARRLGCSRERVRQKRREWRIPPSPMHAKKNTPPFDLQGPRYGPPPPFPKKRGAGRK